MFYKLTYSENDYLDIKLIIIVLKINKIHLFNEEKK